MPMLAVICSSWPATKAPQSIDDLARNVADVFRPGDVGEDDIELVAADPGHGVRLPDVSLNLAGDLFQQLVPGLVAQRVVDLLEPVEVQEQDRQLRSGAGAPGPVPD